MLQQIKLISFQHIIILHGDKLISNILKRISTHTKQQRCVCRVRFHLNISFKFWWAEKLICLHTTFITSSFGLYSFIIIMLFYAFWKTQMHSLEQKIGNEWIETHWYIRRDTRTTILRWSNWNYEVDSQIFFSFFYLTLSVRFRKKHFASSGVVPA